MKPWQQTLAGFLLGLVVVGAIILVVSPQKGQPITLVTRTPNLTPDPTSTPKLIRVHITGSVQLPGVYTLPENARVEDAIQAAGGLQESSDPQLLNLAAALVDGQRIYIPSAQDGNLSTDDRGLSIQTSPMVNINTASFAELDSLPGIGEVKAQAILDYRQKNGLFTALEDLLKVGGINQSLFEKLVGLITLGE
jgi:competence protein ComEA